MDSLVTVMGQEQRPVSARRVLGIRAVEHDLAVLVDQLVWFVQRFDRDPLGTRDSVRNRLDVQRRPQIEDHRVLAGFQPPLELDGRYSNLPEMTEEASPSRKLEGE